MKMQILTIIKYLSVLLRRDSVVQLAGLHFLFNILLLFLSFLKYKEPQDSE